MSAEKPRANRDTALEDALRRIRILERVIPEKGCKYAVASASNVSVPVGTPGTLVLPDLTVFDTNDPDMFAQDTSGTTGHSGGVLIQKEGRFLALARAQYVDPVGGAVEPATSQMYAGWDAYSYNGSQSDFAINQTIATGVPGFPKAPWGTDLTWSPWNLDQQDIGAAFVGPPYSEYHVALYNNGTQTMSADVAIMVIWLGTSSGL